MDTGYANLLSDAEKERVLALTREALPGAPWVGGAYIDQFVLNVFDGPGLTDVYIDDLEIGPVLQSESSSVAETTNPTVIARPTGSAATRRRAARQRPVSRRIE